MKSLTRFMTGFAALLVGLMFVVTGAFAAPVDNKAVDKRAVMVEKIEKPGSSGFFGNRGLFANPFAISPFAFSPFAFSPFAFNPFLFDPFDFDPFDFDPFDFDEFDFDEFDFDRFDRDRDR